MCHLKTFLIIVVAIYPVTALAQNADDENEERVLEEIIVTATKREVNLQDLPLSVSVLTGQQLADVGATRMDYYWRMIPSLNVKDGPVGGDSVIIRGLSDTTSFFQNESLNAFFIDDTAVTLVPGLFNTPGDPALIDVARVEVLRGPQGTLVGANAMGGVIRVITQEPDIEMTSRSLDMNLSSTAHGGLNYGGNIILNQPLSNGNSAIRLVAFYQDEDGFINDIGLQNKISTANNARAQDFPGYGMSRTHSKSWHAYILRILTSVATIMRTPSANRKWGFQPRVITR